MNKTKKSTITLNGSNTYLEGINSTELKPHPDLRPIDESDTAFLDLFAEAMYYEPDYFIAGFTIQNCISFLDSLCSLPIESAVTTTGILSKDFCLRLMKNPKRRLMKYHNGIKPSNSAGTLPVKPNRRITP